MVVWNGAVRYIQRQVRLHSQGKARQNQVDPRFVFKLLRLDELLDAEVGYLSKVPIHPFTLPSSQRGAFDVV